MQQYSSGKRVGFFFLALAAFVAEVAALLGISILFMIVALVHEMAVSGRTILASQEAYMEIFADYLPAATFITHVLTISVFSVWYKFIYKKPRPTIRAGLKKLNPLIVIGTIGVGLTIAVFAYGVVFAEYLIVPDIYASYVESIKLNGMDDSFLGIAAAAVLAPIGEEFLCRGVIMEYFRRSFGKFWIANLAQALLFGLLHMNWVQGVYAFVGGLALGFVAKECGTVLASMIVHFTLNLSSYTWGDWLFGGIEEPTYLLTGMVVVIPWMAAIPILVWLKNYIAKRKEQKAQVVNGYGA